MLKMYRPAALSGDRPEFWDENWAGANLDEALRFCEVDPLRPLIERFAPEGALVLEGGCGVGQYVMYYGARGRTVVGLDFARTTLTALRRECGEAVLCAASVADLPFRSAVFDAYFSGGVVEHFERGPYAALREAWRVLRPGGTLLVSVPYFNPLRRVLAGLGWRRKDWQQSREFDASGTCASTRGSFWQYAFTPGEFRAHLLAAGFRVVVQQPYAVLWGLYDIPLFERASMLLRRMLATRVAGDCAIDHPASDRPDTPDERAPEPANTRTRVPVLTRLAVAEDRSLPVLGALLGIVANLAANMIMFVAIKADQAVPRGDHDGAAGQAELGG